MLRTISLVENDDRLDDNRGKGVGTQQTGKEEPDDGLDLIFPPLPDEAKFFGEVFVEESVDDGIGARARHAQHVTHGVDGAKNLEETIQQN